MPEICETAASHTLLDAQPEDRRIHDLQKPLNEGNEQLKLAKELKKRWQMTHTISRCSITIKIIKEDASCSHGCAPCWMG